MTISMALPQFDRPELFGHLTPEEQVIGTRHCQEAGGIRALGFHPNAINLNNTTSFAYYCAFSIADLKMAGRINHEPSVATLPRLIQKKIINWRNPNTFGPIPADKKAIGMKICKKQGRANVIGYHPRALDNNGKPIAGGGFLCQ